MDQRRLLLAFALSLGLLVLYQEFVLKRYQPPPGLESAPSSTTIPPPPGPDAGGAGATLGAPTDGAGVVEVETDAFRGTIALAGGRLQSLKLKAYRSTVAADSPLLNIVLSAPVLPVTLQIGEAGDAAVAYRSDRTELSVRGDQHEEVILVGQLADGRTIEKRFQFRGTGYVFDVASTISAGATSVALVLTPLAHEDPGSQGPTSAIVLHDRKVSEQEAKALLTAEKPTAYPLTAWGGFATQYFLVAAMPKEGSAMAVARSSQGVPVMTVEVPAVEGRAEFSVYAGPKEREDLVPAGHGLERALDFGYFWFVAIPLLHALRVLHMITGNYGVAIIVLTTLVKLATVPLTQATFRNMREMQKLQPQMVKLRERFKDDQAALQKEMMELYRRHRVNPLSGCLPMVLQLPIFVGLYNALIHAIELRHAPFMLWINDLSAPDRLMVVGFGIPVLTLLMGATMFVQQWLTPQQGDPTQQRMMMIMPVVFTFMFINFPAGLVLYWLVNNVLSIGQQYLMLRSST